MLISIVIPLYNKGPYVERALHSVFAQTHDEWELIVVDDGSTDEGPDAVQPYLSDKIRMVHQNNAGVSAARNRGAELARSDYIVFLDGDDEWLPEFLSRIDVLIKLNPDAGLFACKHETVYPNAIIETRRIGLDDNHCGHIDNVFDQMRRFPWLIQISGCCFSKKALTEAGSFPVGENYGEDAYMISLIAQKWPVMYDARVSFRYYSHIKNSLASINVGEVPFHLRYLLQQDRATKRDPHFFRYLMHGCVVNSAAGARVRNMETVRFLAQATWPLDKLTSIKCHLLLFMPRWMVNVIVALRRAVLLPAWQPVRVPAVPVRSRL